jgi:hypothetical protein
MTPEEHKRLLGILHLVYGGMHGLLAVVLIIAFGVPAAVIVGNSPGGDGAPLALVVFALLLALLFSVLFLIPPVVAGYGLLKHRPWARTASLVASIIEVFNFPFGTGLAVYNFWLLFGQDVRPGGAELFGTAATRPALGGAAAQPAYGTFGRGRENEYAPPPQPPDWRGE